MKTSPKYKAIIVARKTKKRPVRSVAALRVVQEHPLIALAKSELDVRRKLFLVAFVTAWEHLAEGDMQYIEETVLHRRVGSVVISKAFEALK